MSAATAARTAAADVQQDAEAMQSAVSDLVRVYQFRDRDRICCHDISVTQCYALEAIVEHGPMRLGALAERLYLDKSTASRVIGTLVKKGYVTQHTDAEDARAVALSATRAGRQLCARITAGLIEEQKALLQDLAPELRAGVIEVIRGLARAAERRFRGNGAGASCCT